MRASTSMDVCAVTENRNVIKKRERKFTVKFVSTLFGLVHPVGEFGHLRHDVVQFGRLPLALHYDWKHTQTSDHGS